MKYVLFVNTPTEYNNNKYSRYEFSNLEDLEDYRVTAWNNTPYEILIPKSELDSASFYKEKFEEIYKLMFDNMFNSKNTDKLKELL